MKLIPQKVIRMTLFLFVFSIIFSCSKDTDLLLDSVLNEPEVSLEEKELPKEEIAENGLVTRTFSFSPTNDAYVQNDQGHNQSIIRLQEDFRTSYLMFDLSQVNGTITEAVLQFSIDSDEGDGGISIHKGLNADWTEENLNQNNAPALDTQLASMNKAYKVGAPEKVVLNAQSLESEATTLIMTHSTGNDLAFASKENPNKKGPKLIITYEAPEGSPLIEQQEEETTPENTAPENTAPENTTPENTAPENTTPENTTPENTTPENTTPEETAPEDNNDNTASTEGAYFVTVNGKSSNDGRSEGTAWSIEHAFENAIAGDIVYIKAGNYGNKFLTADNSGAPNKPIKFIGYTNAPGDLLSQNGSTFKYGDQIDSQKMPLLIGNPSNNEGIGTAIVIGESYIHIENIQITKYEKGIYSNGNSCILKNVIVTKMGDFNPAHSYPTATNQILLNYSGNGIILGGSNSELHNSFALNCGAQAITINNGSNKKTSFNSVYSDNNVNPTDYYFLIAEGTTNSNFSNTTIHRVGQLSHLGHGIVFKGNGKIEGNTVSNFTITNTVLEVQFPKTKNNIIKNGVITKEKHVNNNSSNVGGILLANGSHDNHFEKIELTNCYLKFNDWNDGLKGDIQDSSDGNTFSQITIKDAVIGISFAYFKNSNLNSSADNNTFTNCTFSNINYLFRADRANSNTILKNSTIKNVNTFLTKRSDSKFSIDADFENCNWTNVNFTPPN